MPVAISLLGKSAAKNAQRGYSCDLMGCPGWFWKRAGGGLLAPPPGADACDRDSTWLCALGTGVQPGNHSSNLKRMAFVLGLWLGGSNDGEGNIGVAAG